MEPDQKRNQWAQKAYLDRPSNEWVRVPAEDLRIYNETDFVHSHMLCHTRGLLVTDRPICFYDESVVPRHPIDVSRIHPARRVYLVPIGDFPAARAAAIAKHFRDNFGVAIDVTPAVDWPEDAYVEHRRQMNSALMLTRLESMYAAPGNPVVAIGLTTRDMFNPAVNWNNVFSYRRNNRVAVVSPARMDRGCMGLVQAHDDRIMARLRKMVGKNIGIMSFGLKMSADPASLLYANSGGPQERGAMSELF